MENERKNERKKERMVKSKEIQRLEKKRIKILDEKGTRKIKGK